LQLSVSGCAAREQLLVSQPAPLPTRGAWCKLNITYIHTIGNANICQGYISIFFKKFFVFYGGNFALIELGKYVQQSVAVSV